MTAKPSNQEVMINGVKTELIPYNIGGYNFFKLKDLGASINFGVDYDETTRTVMIKSA